MHINITISNAKENMKKFLYKMSYVFMTSAYSCTIIFIRVCIIMVNVLFDTLDKIIS